MRRMKNRKRGLRLSLERKGLKSLGKGGSSCRKLRMVVMKVILKIYIVIQTRMLLRRTIKACVGIERFTV